MTGLCTDGTVYVNDSTIVATDAQNKNTIPIRALNVGLVYEFIYNYGALIISNEKSGGTVRYEFALNNY